MRDFSTTKSGRSLRSAIDSLYTTFKDYSLRPHVEGCPHCVGERDHARLHEAPLRELTSEQLGKYAFKAMTTWGDADDFRHFLPRILELVAGDEDWLVEPATVLGKLTYADWNVWTAKERRAIGDFVTAWWSDFLTAYPPLVPWRCFDMLCCLGVASDDLKAYLHDWLADQRIPARHHLAEFIRGNYASLFKKGRLESAFWGGRERQREEVELWMRESNLRVVFERAAQATSDSDIQDEFLQAMDYLDWLGF